MQAFPKGKANTKNLSFQIVFAFGQSDSTAGFPAKTRGSVMIFNNLNHHRSVGSGLGTECDAAVADGLEPAGSGQPDPVDPH